MELTEAHRSLDLMDYATVLFDIDGTLLIGESLTPGAHEFVSACRSAGASIGFVTNASMPTFQQIAALLASHGLGRPGDLLVTAAVTVAAEIVRQGYQTVVCAGHAGLASSLVHAGLEVIPADSPAARSLARAPGSVALAVGLFPDELPPVREHLEILLRAGVPCFVPTVEPHWPTPDGLKPGNGAVLASLQETIDFTVIICGKPSDVFAEELKRSRELREPLLVVGDTAAADVALARANGWHSLLLLTGSTTRDESDAMAPSGTSAMYVFNDLV
ncbi:MAG: HAD hydrolase-like protein, partial [bacterium]|nr:HAD hydrolase-like protein [bacterium]